ncbi:MAG: pyridoxal phosphate-dependent aminotransferase [Pseudomonadota bacterium]
MTKPVRFTPLVKDLPATVPFVGPEAQERNTGIEFRARLGANESCFGPSPKAVAAMQAAVGDTWKYGDPENHELQNAIATLHGVNPGNIMIGEGIDGLLGCLCHLFVEPGRHVVTSLGSYPTFNFHVKSRGGELDLVSYKDDHEDPEALVDKARKTNAVLLYFSNPNNPMGTWRTAAEMEELVANVPEGTILVLDEAYIECAPDGVAPPIDVSNPQVLRFRTFSKAYGMAGARVGYVIGHRDVVTAFDKVRNHYGMNRTGQIGALAALNDQAWLENVVARFAAGRDRIHAIATDNSLASIPSATNFVGIDCGQGPDFAKAVLAEFLKRGIFIRMPGVEPQSRCIRVSVGHDHELEMFAEELPGVLRSVG